ncbi:MAG: hypothetical protein ACREF4_15750, partial [Gammaproteobacteria bacterium]
MRRAVRTALLLLSLPAALAAQGYVSPPTRYLQDDSYDRGEWKHWIKINGCIDIRQQVLIDESVVPVTLDAKGCRVLKGEWHDPYT